MLTNLFLSSAVLFLAVTGLCLLAFMKIASPASEDGYVGSARCIHCHEEQNREWSGSLHTKMMRPADDPGVVVARFAESDEGRQFELDEAVWAIGGKWEQQFMGHNGERETLLPGVWLGEIGTWDFKGWDGWQEPIPLSRCHGCHTVGLDVETGQFVEPNIGCESCHGPGEWHVVTNGLGRIHAGSDSETCGQCHARGVDPSNEYFFPVGFRPGMDLDAHFRFDEPSPDQTSSSWWGNGSERRRHQEYTAWRVGGHAHSLEALKNGYDGRYGEVTAQCLSCHSGDYILAPERSKPSFSDVKQGITCAVCHNAHGDLDQARVDCAACHTTGAFEHGRARNADHVPCPADAEVGCVDCHMPLTGTLGGLFSLHSHRPGIVQPIETERWGVPNSCSNGGCHEREPAGDMQARFDQFY